MSYTLGVCFLLSMLPVIAFCGGVLYRCRGGFIGTGNSTVARLMYWCLPSAFLFVMAYHVKTGELSLLLGLAATLALWVGLLIPHGWTQNNTFKDFAGMAGVGLCRGAVLAAALAYWYGWPAVALIPAYGFGSGVGYMLGWSFLNGVELIKWHPANDNADDGSGFDKFAVSGGEWGEVLTGAWTWLLWYSTLLALVM